MQAAWSQANGGASSSRPPSWDPAAAAPAPSPASTFGAGTPHLWPSSSPSPSPTHIPAPVLPVHSLFGFEDAFQPAAAASPVASSSSPAAAAIGSAGFSDINLATASPSGLTQRRAAGSAAASASAADMDSSPLVPSRFSSSPAAAASAALDAPMTVRHFLQQLLTRRFLTLVAVLVVVFGALSLPLVLRDVESDVSSVLGAGAAGSPPPSSDRTLFCPSPAHERARPAILARLESWQPQCIPCPVHGECGPDGTLRCYDSYMRVHHTCVTRSALNERALAYKEAAVLALQEHAGRHQCGDESAWAREPLRVDLTTDEMRARVVPAKETLSPDLRDESDRAWALVASEWLRAEAPHVQLWRRDNPFQRLLYVHTDSRQMPRYRAVYPTRSLACRVRLALWTRPLRALLYGAAGASVVMLLLALAFLALWAVGSRTLLTHLLDGVREDYYFDYDRRLLVHQPHAVAAQRDDFLAREAAQLRPNAWRLERELHALLCRCIWARARRLMDARHGRDIECDTHAFQYGAEASWKWIGPRPASAASHPRSAVQAAEEPDPLLSPTHNKLSASRVRRPASEEELYGATTMGHMHDL